MKRRTIAELEAENRSLLAYQRLCWNLLKGEPLDKLTYGDLSIEVSGLAQPEGGVAVWDRCHVAWVEDTIRRLSRGDELSHERGLARRIRAAQERAVETAKKVRREQVRYLIDTEDTPR